MQLSLVRQTAQPTTRGQSVTNALHVGMLSSFFVAHELHNTCRLIKMGIAPVVKTEASTQSYSYVVFSAPPSGSQDYVGEVSSLQACRLAAHHSVQLALIDLDMA